MREGRGYMRVMTNSPISFPGLFGDWEFTAGEVALDIGKGIYWYGIIIAFGVIAAVISGGTAIITALGTKEVDTAIRQQNEK